MMYAKVTAGSGKILQRAVLRLAVIVLTGLAVTACDKCGNSVFRADAGPLACRDQAPR